MHLVQRDIVKWLQSLDLSCALKTPRRDLCNGFMVAEILSRYNKEVQMHSIDTGLAVTRRLDNWAQIKKYLSKMHCTTVPDELINDTLQGREGAAVKLLSLLYTFLTKRELKEDVFAPERAAMASHALMPGYARPTAAKVLRDANDQTQERVAKMTGKTDEQKLRAHSEQLLDHHMTEMQAIKLVEPQRYVPVAHGNLRSHTGHSGSRDAPKLRQKMQVARELAGQWNRRGVGERIQGKGRERAGGRVPVRI